MLEHLPGYVVGGLGFIVGFGIAVLAMFPRKPPRNGPGPE